MGLLGIAQHGRKWPLTWADVGCMSPAVASGWPTLGSRLGSTTALAGRPQPSNLAASFAHLFYSFNGCVAPPEKSAPGLSRPPRDTLNLVKNHAGQFR